MTHIALTIAGSDSSGGAGVQADLKTFSALGVYGASAITALTAQNTRGVYGVVNIDPEFVREQIDACFADLRIQAVKIGMLSTPDIVEAVVTALEVHRPAHIVVDPVMVSESGARLLSQDAVNILVTRLFPLASLITPNLHEAAVLLGEPVLEDDSAMEACARKIAKLGTSPVLLKGGHFNTALARDVLIDGGELTNFDADRINTKNTHGTGCTLSAAIATGLALKLSLPQAITQAKAYVTGAIKAADQLEVGEGPGPLNHFYRVWPLLEAE